MRCVLLLSTCLIVLAPLARAQDGGACVSADREYAKKLAEARKGGCEVSCKGCGCKGGPGYRSLRSGHCVGYRNLNSECGPPPHDRCQRECTPVVVGCQPPSVPQGPPARHESPATQ